MPSFNYDDIINLPYPHDDRDFFLKHPRMSMSARAKIFNPFAALRGHSELIDSTAKKHLSVSHDDLMEGETSELDDAFLLLSEAFEANKKPKITVTFFVPSKKALDGVAGYATISGIAKKLDVEKRVLYVNEKQISLHNIRKIEIVDKE